MANLDSYTKSSVIFASTVAFPGTTGDALTLSTAAGFPYTSTGIDMAGYEGVLVTATFIGSTFGSLKAMGGQSSASSTGYNDLTGAVVAATTSTNAISTAKFSLVLDLYRPRNRWVAFQASVPTTSGFPTSITALQYGPKREPAQNDPSVSNSTVAVSPSS